MGTQDGQVFELFFCLLSGVYVGAVVRSWWEPRTARCLSCFFVCFQECMLGRWSDPGGNPGRPGVLEVVFLSAFRSVCWGGGQVLVGTQDSQVFELFFVCFQECMLGRWSDPGGNPGQPGV